MPTSFSSRFNKLKLRKLNHMIVGGTLAITIVLAPLAWAVLLDSATYNIGVAVQKAELVVQQGLIKAESLAQQAVAKAIDAAQQQLQTALSEKANALAAGIKDKLTSAVQDKMGAITGGAVGKLLTNAGVPIGTVAGPNVAGHVDPAVTDKQMAEMSAIKNPVDAIALQTKITLQDKLHDRLNVTSMLDEKPAANRCRTTTTNCTILTMLREYDDVALADLQKANIGAVAYQVEQKGMWSSAVLNQVYMLAGTDTFNVLAFLTPSHSIPLGFDRNAATAATLDKSMWLSQVMVGGKNDAQFLAKEMQNSKGADTAAQLDAMAKIAKVQLARGAIMNVHNENLHLSLNAQFRACVVRPDVQDRVGATQEQQLVHIQSLLRCSNMIQLQQRQQEMESQRLLGTMLLTLLDLYAVQEPKKR